MNSLRIPLDITMTALSVILMGGTILFSDDRVHQVLGMVLIALWAVHIALNRKWYGAVLKGKYNPYRIMQTVINLSILVCIILLAVSGMMMAWFLPESVNVPLGFARTAHLVSSHWYYVFMSLHLGMHVGMIANKIRLSRSQQECHSRALTRESPDKAKRIKAIDFWLSSYMSKWFVRWSILDKRAQKAIGTIELFHRTANDFFNDAGILRVDVKSEYEKTQEIKAIVSPLLDRAFSLFDTNRIATKIPLYAIERKAAFESLGFAQSDEHLIGTIDGYAYKDYWILEKGAENE